MKGDNVNNLLWRDYIYKADKKLDRWIEEEYSENANLVNKYALFNEPISKIYRWYKKHPYEMSSIRSYLKVAEVDYQVIAFIILNYGMVDNKLMCSINPFVIDPKHINKGYGSIVLKNFLENAEEILQAIIDAFDASIDKENIVAIRLFEKMGFKKIGTSPDQTFIYYEKENK